MGSEMQLIGSPPRKLHRGVTLIEVLVAMVVMSFGMLGIAGLQVATAKFQQGSRVRGMLAPTLSDIANRIRSNSDEAGDNAATTGTYTSSYALSDTWDTQQSAMPLTVLKECEKDGVSCSTSERSSYDMVSWRMRANVALPQGAALLSGNRANGFQVTLMWLDKSLANDGVLIKAPLCSTATEKAAGNRMGQQNCCPTEANAPEGVRCNRFTFVP
jgi:type IV pilus assembly protein PilV